MGLWSSAVIDVARFSSNNSVTVLNINFFLLALVILEHGG